MTFCFALSPSGTAVVRYGPNTPSAKTSKEPHCWRTTLVRSPVPDSTTPDMPEELTFEQLLLRQPNPCELKHCHTKPVTHNTHDRLGGGPHPLGDSTRQSPAAQNLKVPARLPIRSRTIERASSNAVHFLTRMPSRFSCRSWRDNRGTRVSWPEIDVLYRD